MGKARAIYKALNYAKGALKEGPGLFKNIGKKPSLVNMKQYGGTVWNKSRNSYGDALKYMAEFKDPVIRGGKNMPKYVDLPKMQHKGGLGKGVRTSLGNTADAVLQIGKDVKGKGIIGGTAQVGKNTGKYVKDQMRGDLYKEVFNPVTHRKGNKTYLKTKSRFLKDREVVSTTNRDSVVVRKRKALTPVSLALGGSGASIGAASYALSDKNKPQSKRLSEAAVDTALFAVSPPIGLAVAFGRAGKATQRKKQKEIKQK